jgi:uncharacterized protein with HEPN domain
MHKDELVYVGHMCDLTKRAVAKVAGKTRYDFDADDNLRLALAHLVQTIGEAARRVSQAFQQQHAEIPWKQIIGMRHKVVHDYMDLDEDILWDVATGELPGLVALLEKIVPDDS